MGDILKITTTHLKDSYLRRNGVNLSDQATLTQYWMRQGDIMSWVQIHYDPVYLAKPYVRITEYRARPGAATMTVEPCIVAGTNWRLREVMCRIGCPDKIRVWMFMPNSLNPLSKPIRADLKRCTRSTESALNSWAASVCQSRGSIGNNRLSEE